MANFETSRLVIDSNITANGNQEISGKVMNNVLNHMVDDTEAKITELEERIENIPSGGGEGGGSSVEVVDSLDSEDTTAALSANQGRVLKEMIEELPSEGTGGGLELRELKMSGTAEDNAYNLETLELIKEGKALVGAKLEGSNIAPLTGLDREFGARITMDNLDVQFIFIVAEDGSVEMSYDTIAPIILRSTSAVIKFLMMNMMLQFQGKLITAYVEHNGEYCLIDYINKTAVGSTPTKVQYNYGNKRFERVYNANTGEEISTTEIPIGEGGGTAAEGAKLYPIYSPKLMGADSITEEQKAVNKAAFEAAARGEQMWCYAAIDDGANKLNALLFNGNAEMLIVTFNVPMVHQDITEQLTNVIITPDGSILHEAQYEVTSPSIERVEEMIAASIGDIKASIVAINGEEV